MPTVDLFAQLGLDLAVAPADVPIQPAIDPELERRLFGPVEFASGLPTEFLRGWK